MARTVSSPRRVTGGVRRAEREVAGGSGAILMVRAGYAAKGVVYLLIGLLTARLALGNGGVSPDRQSALTALYAEPFGKVVLSIVALGLAGYAVWSFVRAAVDPEREGSDAKGMIARAGFAAVGVSYGLLAFGAYHLVTGTGTAGRSSDATTQDWTSRLLHQPFGVALVVLLGLVVLAVAGTLFGRAYTAHFQQRLALSAVSAQTRTWIVRLGRCGLAALGIVFSEVGIFLVVAALHHDPQRATGLGGALRWMTYEPYGHVLLAVMAAGLAAYGLYSLAEARYRRIG
ncbi:MAG: DUF1206 domain-containing protein [Chloroflexota bacterium]